MADKEERIIIAVAEPSLLEGGADKIYPCMTKKEAIEVMAKGVCLELRKDFCSCRCVGDKSCNSWKRYKTFATAALNALLEGVKK